MEKAEMAVEGAVMSSGFAKGAPVAVGGAVSGLSFFGVPVPDLVPLLTCIYLALMILHQAWKWWAEWKARARDAADDDGGEK